MKRVTMGSFHMGRACCRSAATCARRRRRSVSIVGASLGALEVMHGPQSKNLSDFIKRRAAVGQQGRVRKIGGRQAITIAALNDIFERTDLRVIQQTTSIQ